MADHDDTESKAGPKSDGRGWLGYIAGGVVAIVLGSLIVDEVRWARTRRALRRAQEREDDEDW